MKILLIANQPESTTRLKLFKKTLESLNYSVVLPKFSSKNWYTISREATKYIKGEKPDIVHLFNVPDIIYRHIPDLKGKYFSKLIYDYRSPWGLEYELIFGPPARIVGEHFERKLSRLSDAIVTVNSPLKNKVQGYLEREDAKIKSITIIPNYPTSEFVQKTGFDDSVLLPEDPFVLFIGRIDKHEGVHNLLNIIKIMPRTRFVVVGAGPFSRYYFWKKYSNVTLTGWQPHSAIPDFIRRSGVCIIPFSETKVSPFITDKSVWKLNEYLNFGKIVIASGITPEEKRKNLNICRTRELPESIKQMMEIEPELLHEGDYRFWEMNRSPIKDVYEALI